MEVSNEKEESKKSHRERRAGRKAERKKEKNKHSQELTAQQKNPKAFSFHSIVKGERKVRRAEDIKSKKHHIPVVNRTPLEPPPVLVAVVGGCKVGKSTLIRGLIKNYTRQKIATIEGPITVVAGKKKRLTFIEVKNDINCMVDIAKVADAVLMLIDISLGIEMEVFEFLEICRAYGTPRVMGILNHIDLMKNNKGLKKRKKDLTHRFQVELYPGAKLFYLSGIIHGEYIKNEISNLGRFISVLKFRPLQFRSTHPYVLVDRMEDITNTEIVRQNPICQRSIVLYGYVRGIPMQPDQWIHVPGVGDYRIKDINILDDPCPLPDKLKKRSLNSKERLLYAPMSGVAGVVYDKDAIYIDLGGSHHGRKAEDEEETEEKEMMNSLLKLQKSTDEKNAETGIRLFSHSNPVSDFGIDSESESEEEGESSMNPSIPQFEAITNEDGSMRRRVIFEDESMVESGIESDASSEYEPDESEDNYEEPPRKKLKNDTNMSDKILEEDDKSSEKQSLIFGPSANLPGFEKSDAVSTKNYISFLKNSIYGEAFGAGEEDESTDDDECDLFKKVKSHLGKKSTKLPGGAELNGMDSFRRVKSISLRNWKDSKTMESIKDCFVTGEWSEHESAQKLLKMDEEDADLYGDFEDLEKGVKYESKTDKTEKKLEEEVEEKKLQSDKTAQERRLEKKLRLKEMFNSEFEGKGNGDHFDDLKAEMNEQAQLNRMQFEDLDDKTRVNYEGFRAGLYVRMEFDGVDSELVTNFDSSYPMIVGGLLDNELTMGYVKVRLKVHRWFPRILKNRDPLYLSLGWRRFQTMVFYAKREDNFRLRSLKYARKYLHVEALFWGPLAEVSSGFVAIQNINDRTPDFSIAANGVVLESDKSTKLVKKLKLIGYPEKIHQKTVFVKDMFHSDTEVTKFEGVKLQTQSSIRGILKKSVGLDGKFRATFEDIIKMSDTIILTTWATIDIPKFCSIVKNLLLPVNAKNQWDGMKTNAQVKREQNIRNLVNPDSLYTEIKERREYVHIPLVIPKKLQKALPYKDKPKNKQPTKKEERIFVVRDPEEVKMKEFMTMLKTTMKDRVMQRRIEKRSKQKLHKKELKKRDEARHFREKKRKAYSCKRKGLKTGKK